MLMILCMIAQIYKVIQLNKKGRNQNTADESKSAHNIA